MLSNLINLKYVSVNAIKYEQFLSSSPHLNRVTKQMRVLQYLTQYIYIY